MAKAKDSKNSTKTKAVAKKTDAKKTAPVRKGPSGQAIRRITTGTTKAHKELTTIGPNGENAESANGTIRIEADAALGIEQVRGLVGIKPIGKLSPLGHSMSGMTGLMDEAILKHGTDFGAIVKYVAKGNAVTRKSNLEDNVALIKRLASHMKNIAGQKSFGLRDLKKRLARVDKEALAGDVASFFTPMYTLFVDYAKAGKF